ncbi:CPBP family intramembrane metalloprotease [Lutimonas saemankumensis]|uniref:CPBP family intramembrane glutamic endopeptidase n=1 Tax=Lutimonas saemankumensis TaxID=483016 RepID=UPI001CD29485|nr:type II CAAX endopeptidase family protein [Lutimonas saemankumensis]MCA0932729.1 CPBP family intramembrane metalloprotease [Lutimonas saemankumensis]
MEKTSHISTIGNLLNKSKLAIIGEILLIFSSAFSLFVILKPLAGENVLLKLGIIWCINVLMLLLIWLGNTLRGRQWADFGLTFGRVTSKEGIRVFSRSLLVFVLGISAYILGTFMMSQISGMPESADMSNYTYLNNIFMLILTLCGVYIVSSFGEEVIYRAFLINRFTELGLDSTFGKILAVIFSSIIFGLVHFEWGPTGIVSTAMMGLVMGIFYLKYKNLWILVLAHAYMDTLLLVPLFLQNS